MPIEFPLRLLLPYQSPVDATYGAPKTEETTEQQQQRGYAHDTSEPLACLPLCVVNTQRVPI